MCFVTNRCQRLASSASPARKQPGSWVAAAEGLGVKAEGAEGGAEEGAVNEGAKVNEVKVTLSTAGYVQANDALRFTAAPNAAGGAPMPSLGGAAGAAFEPAVLYSHTMTLRRV